MEALFKMSENKNHILYIKMKTLFSLNLADDIIGHTTIESNPGQTSTVVNDRIFLVYGRIRSFTESVTFDLGNRVGCKESACEHF